MLFTPKWYKTVKRGYEDSHDNLNADAENVCSRGLRPKCQRDLKIGLENVNIYGNRST